MKCAIILQQANDLPGGSFMLETKTIDLETGEIVTERMTARPSFAWDIAVEAALDDATKQAERAGFTDIRVDSPFYDAIQARRRLLNEMRD